MPFSFTAFGGGRHGCMGENFAYMQVRPVELEDMSCLNHDATHLASYPPLEPSKSLKYCVVMCVQIKTIWSILLRNFELELISPFPEIDWDSLVVGPKGKVMLRYRRRKL